MRFLDDSCIYFYFKSKKETVAERPSPLVVVGKSKSEKVLAATFKWPRSTRRRTSRRRTASALLVGLWMVFPYRLRPKSMAPSRRCGFCRANGAERCSTVAQSANTGTGSSATERSARLRATPRRPSSERDRCKEKRRGNNNLGWVKGTQSAL